MKLGEHQRSKQRGQKLCWKVHNGAHLLSYTHTLCKNYIIPRFLLYSCMNKPDYLFCRFLCMVNPQNKKQKHKTKNFAGFHNHFPLLATCPISCVCAYVFFGRKIINYKKKKLKKKKTSSNWAFFFAPQHSFCGNVGLFL